VKEMDYRIAEWVQQNLAKHGHRGDPMQKVIETGPFKYVTPGGWAQRLRTEGREEVAEELLAKYSKKWAE
jgi:hypothetical protein